MSKKVSISLPEHVYSLAKKKSKLTHGDNFSGYIRDLVCRQFTEEELKNELKPIWAGREKVAEYETDCRCCTKKILKGSTIYLTNLGYWVHEECCRKE